MSPEDSQDVNALYHGVREELEAYRERVRAGVEQAGADVQWHKLMLAEADNRLRTLYREMSQVDYVLERGLLREP